MSSNNRSIVKWSLAILLLLLLPAGMTGSAYAQEAFIGEDVGPGEVIENDVVMGGDTIDLDGEVDGDVFAAGGDTTIDGAITGSLFAFARTVTINGQVDGSLYVIAVRLILGPDAKIGHNVHFIGVDLVMEEGATIGRDLAAISLSARIEGEVARESRLLIGALQIVRLLMDKLNIAVTGRSFSEINPFRAPAQLTATPAGGHFSLLAQDEAGDAETASSVSPYWDFLRRLGGFMIVGLLLIWLAPAHLDGWSQQLRRRPVLSFGIGIVVFILGFVGFILLLVLAIAVALAFFSLTFINLGYMLLGLTVAAIGLGFTIFLLFVVFISKVVVAYMAGRMILGRLLPRALRYRVWPLLLGVVLYMLLNAIPYVGWAVSMIVTLLGLGAVGLALLKLEQRNDTPLPAGDAAAPALPEQAEG